MAFSLKMFAQLLKSVGPLILGATGVPPALIPVVVHGIELAESGKTTFGTGTGAQKKAFVLDAVETAVNGINAAKPGTAVEGYKEAVSDGIDATIGVINVIKAQQTLTASHAASTSNGSSGS